MMPALKSSSSFQTNDVPAYHSCAPLECDREGLSVLRPKPVSRGADFLRQIVDPPGVAINELPVCDWPTIELDERFSRCDSVVAGWMFRTIRGIV
jgi:hypothetical protein